VDTQSNGDGLTVTPAPKASQAEWTEAEDRFWGCGPFGPRSGIADDVWAERKRQIEKRGMQERPSGTDASEWIDLEQRAKSEHDLKEAYPDIQGPLTWVDILKEEVYEAFAEEDPDALRVELVQVMAVAASWIQDLDRRGDL
jgi:hypothetical protein